MKKLFTGLFLLLALNVVVMGQNKQNAVVRKQPNAVELLKHYSLLDGPQSAPKIAPYNNNAPALTASSTITKVPFGSSYNAYGLLVSSSTCLAANEDLDLVTMIHRQCASYSGGAGASGYVQTTGTTDLGANVDSSSSRIIVNNDVHHCRYPSGVIYNPSGNTDPSQAFMVVSGPFHPGQDWDGYYFGSMRLDGQYNDQQFITTSPDSGNHFPREGFSVTEAGRVYVSGVNVNPNYASGDPVSSYKYKGNVLNTGTFDAITNTFSWTDTLFTPNYRIDADGFPEFGSSSAQTAWSLDGEIGYMVFIGILDTSAMTHNNPIVYKTSDGGISWNMVDLYDFSAINTINENIVPTVQGTTRPVFTLNNGWDATVDANGNLHLIIEVASGYTDHVDSAGYTWNLDPNTSDPLPNFIYDVFTTSTGWDAILVGTVLTSAISDTDAPNVTGLSVGWDARVQISRTKDGSKIFYSWMDTDPNLSDYNMLPDIFVRGYDISTGKVTDVKNLTQGTDYDANNYWLFLSNFTFADNGTYTLHLTTSLLVYNDDEDVTNHYYMKGVELTDADFTSDIKEIASNKFSISQAYPNPFNAETSFDLSLTESANVTIEVVNTMGQKVNSYSNRYNAGSNHIVVDGDDLQSGIYFCSVNINGKSKTIKLIKE